MMPLVPRGLTMVELIITLFLFTTAILGYMSIHLSLQQAHTNVTFRLLASARLQELAYRIRANPSSYSSYQNAINTPADCKQRPLPFCADHRLAGIWKAAQPCDASALAYFDVWDIQCADSTRIIPNWYWSLDCSDQNIQGHCQQGALLRLRAQWTTPGTASNWSLAREFGL